MAFEVDGLVRVRCPLEQGFSFFAFWCPLGLPAQIFCELLKSGFERVRLLKASSLRCHRVLLLRGLKSAGPQPVGHVRTSFALTRFSKNVIALQPLGQRVGFFAKLHCFFAETLLERLFETTPFPHGAPPCLN